MATTELTYVNRSHAEAYAVVDVDTGAVLDVYARPADVALMDRAVGCWRPGTNPLFIHSVTPATALAYLHAHWQSTDPLPAACVVGPPLPDTGVLGADETETDYEGRPVPPGETDDTRILVWEVAPHPGGLDTNAVLVVRSWQQMLACVRYNLDGFLERPDAADLRSPGGVALTFRLIEMTRGEYAELEAG